MADLPYRWVVVAAGGIMGCVAMGALFALPVLLNPMAEATEWSRTGISAAMTIAFLSMAVTSIFWGALTDRYGARPVILAGAALFAVALFAAGRAPGLVWFQLIFGLFAGGAVAAFFAPMMANVTGWSTTRRGLAVSLVSAGMGLAPVTMSPLAGWLIGHYDWRAVFTILAVIAAVITLPLALLMRDPPERTEAGRTMADAPSAGMSLRQALSSPQFIVLVGANFFCCATHSGPIFHTVSYAQFCGIAAMAAVTIYSVEGIAGMGGRIGFGLMGDRFGAKRVLSIGLLAQAFGALGFFFARDLWEFYLFAAIFGFIYAGVMPLYNVLIRENFPPRMMGTIMGATGTAGSLGMASGPLLGGFIFDSTGSYGGLYLASFGFGLFAFLIATTFRPFPKGREPQTVAA